MKFRDPQISYYVKDINRSAEFYRDLLGFQEGFRTPKEGPPVHMDVRFQGFTLGLVDRATASRVLGFEALAAPLRAELVLWTDDVDREYASQLEKDVPGIVAPHDFLETLRRAWVADPDGNPVQLVARREDN